MEERMLTMRVAITAIICTTLVIITLIGKIGNKKERKDKGNE